MAKFRLINTKFWDDTYIAELSSNEKLLYLYFISNPLTTVAGIYEITLKRIQFDTGLKSETLKKIINKFHKNKKVFFEKGWIFVVNFAKNQRANESMKIGIERELACVPPLIKAKFDTLSDGIDTLSDSGVYRDLNLNPNRDLNLNPKEKNLEQLVECWNNIKITSSCKNPSVILRKPLMMKCTRLTAEVKKATDSSLKKYSVEEVHAAIGEYAKDIANRKQDEGGYFEHRFSFLKFLEQKNGLTEFITRVPNAE